MPPILNRRYCLCGQWVAQGWRFCPQCGSALDDSRINFDDPKALEGFTKQHNGGGW